MPHFHKCGILALVRTSSGPGRFSFLRRQVLSDRATAARPLGLSQANCKQVQVSLKSPQGLLFLWLLLHFPRCRALRVRMRRPIAMPIDMAMGQRRPSDIDPGLAILLKLRAGIPVPEHTGTAGRAHMPLESTTRAAGLGGSLQPRALALMALRYKLGGKLSDRRPRAATKSPRQRYEGPWVCPAYREGRYLFSTHIAAPCFLTFVRRVHSQTLEGRVVRLKVLTAFSKFVLQRY